MCVCLILDHTGFSKETRLMQLLQRLKRSHFWNFSEPCNNFEHIGKVSNKPLTSPAASTC